MEFQRKKIRLPRLSYIGNQWYFVTCCTDGRKQRFSDTVCADLVLQAVKTQAAERGFRIEAYCFMPDHLHLLVSATKANSDLVRFVSAFKQATGYVFGRSNGQRLWQGRYYDHILRSTDRWEAVAEYIWTNPVRRGLCARPQDWPFSGSETVDWRRLLKIPESVWVPPWKQTGRSAVEQTKANT